MPLQVIQIYKSWISSPPQVASALRNKNEVVTQCLYYINILGEPAEEGCKIRWKYANGH